MEKEVNQRRQIYLWDGNAAGFYEEGEESPQYYLQDELRSLLRIEGEGGSLRESYGYDEFGCDLYQNQGRLQPFGYTGYQHDGVAGTYFAQAREYQVELGRFGAEDLLGGSIISPITQNRYGYCGNQPINFIDSDGMSREDAREYMEQHGKEKGNTGKPEYNSNYPVYKSNCVNFVSQTLVAGGVEMNDSWYVSQSLNENTIGKVLLKIGAMEHRVLFGKDVYYNDLDKKHDVLLSSTWNNAKRQYEYFSNKERESHMHQ